MIRLIIGLNLLNNYIAHLSLNLANSSIIAWASIDDDIMAKVVLKSKIKGNFKKKVTLFLL